METRRVDGVSRHPDAIAATRRRRESQKKDAAARGSPPRRKWSCSKTWTWDPPTAARGLRETLRKSYMLSMRLKELQLLWRKCWGQTWAAKRCGSVKTTRRPHVSHWQSVSSGRPLTRSQRVLTNLRCEGVATMACLLKNRWTPRRAAGPAPSG